MKTNRTFKLITAIGESILGIPIIGGMIVLGLFWTPLFIMFIFHIFTLFYSHREDSEIHGSILGLITSVLGWVPILGWVLHVSTAIVLWISFAQNE